MSKIRARFIQLATILLVIAALQILVLIGLLPQRTFPLVTDDLRALAGEVVTTEFWSNVLLTLAGWAFGLGIAAAVAIPLGLLIGANAWIQGATRALVEFLRPVPSVALVPLAVLTLGTGMQSKVFLAAFAALWPILIGTVYGIRDVDPVAMDTARSFGVRRRDRVLSVLLPSALPYIATSLRVASATALILAVTAELVIGSPGIGQSVAVAQASGEFEIMYGLIFATGVLGLAINTTITRAEHRVLRWHPAYRKQAT